MYCVSYEHEHERLACSENLSEKTQEYREELEEQKWFEQEEEVEEKEAPEEAESNSPAYSPPDSPAYSPPDSPPDSHADESDESGLPAVLRANSPTSVNLNASIGRGSPPSPTRSPSPSPPSPSPALSSTPPSRSINSAFDTEFDQIQRLLETKPSPSPQQPQSHSHRHRSPTCSPRASPSSSPPSSPSALLVRTSTLSPAGNSHSAHSPIVIQLSKNSALLAQLSVPLSNSPAAAVDGGERERELKPDVQVNSNANANSNASVVPAMRFSPLKAGSALQQFLNEPTSSASLLDAASPPPQLRSTPTTPISPRSSPAPSAAGAGSSPSLVYVKAKVSSYSSSVLYE